jgi:hypothetical protein
MAMPNLPGEIRIAVFDMGHLYKVFVKKTSTGEVWELFPLSYSFTDELNDESTASFDVSFEDFKRVTDKMSETVVGVFSDSFREIWIERDNTKIFWGVISEFSIDPSEKGDRKVSLKAISWFGVLSKRITTVPKRVFTATDAGVIAWTLIDESQDAGNGTGADLGLLEGSITASKDRDRTYRFDKIKDVIIALSNNNLADGFDFDIDMTKHFNVYYPTKGQNRFDLTFDIQTIATYKYKKPLILELVNRVHAIGEGENDDVLYTTRDAVDGYKTDWYLLEETLQEREIKELVTLQDKGDRRLADGQSPIVELSIEHYDDLLQWSDYNLGDSIKVNLPEIGFANETKRIVKRSFDMKSEKSIGYIKIETK